MSFRIGYSTESCLATRITKQEDICCDKIYRTDVEQVLERLLFMR